ncbi:MAG: serine/threonine dehydratase [Chlamydiales bacterium]|jgi:threonine dehydratase|nr:serine/threonine dehydratase [Chlamydiales bacterium]
MDNIPILDEIKKARTLLDQYILKTPVWNGHCPFLKGLIGSTSEVYFKLEQLQHTGCFKIRGALLSLLNLSPEDRKKGVTTISGGNHAIAVSYAAFLLGISAVVFLPKTVSPMRIKKCKEYGATIHLAENVSEAFNQCIKFSNSTGIPLIHPFEGKLITLGTATLGVEFHETVNSLNAIVVACGGGGLLSGVSLATKLLSPQCKVYAVEPEGADAMCRSLEQGNVIRLPTIKTIADSLGAPMTEPYSLGICQKYVDKCVRVSDEQIIEAMRYLYSELKMAIEPAGATALAGLLYPLRKELYNQRIGILICGSNIDIDLFHKYTSFIA